MPKPIRKPHVTFPRYLPDTSHIDLSITRQDINLLLLESHRKAENASEEIAALRELSKLNDLYPSTTSKVELSITHVEKTLKELEALPTEDLLRLAGEDVDLLSLPEPLEGKYKEVEEMEVDTQIQRETRVMPMEDS
jgi:hypothetical protein